MITVDVPEFPRGFVLATRPVDVPASFEPGPLLPNFHVHPWLHVDTAGDTDQFVAILGTCVPISGTDDQPAETLLGKLRESEGEFLRALDHYVGRHAIIYGTATAPRVVNDATGMRAVFYAANGGVIASHAILVEQARRSPAERSNMPYGYGYPGNHTPFPNTRLLIPNTLLEVDSATVRRFWPPHALAVRTVDDVAEMALGAAVNALRGIAKGRTVRLALTAGLDSRTMFAVALQSGISFDTYTYGIGPDTAMDRAFAADFAQRFDVTHTLPPRVPVSLAIREQMDLAHYAMHHKLAVPTLMEFFDDPSAIAVTANLLEIGRSFYTGARRAGAPSPTTAEAMFRLHSIRRGNRRWKLVEEYGVDEFEAASIAAFQSFIDDSELANVEGLLDPFDHFYWEHRMATWHGAAMVERDFYAEPFIPFNSRSIFEAMLGIPQELRDTSAVFHRMIEMVNPALLEMPINPKTWPPVAAQ